MKLELKLGENPIRALKILKELSQPLGYTLVGNTGDYIQIPDTNFAMARIETHKGLTQRDAIYALNEDGLFMPNLFQFTKHYLNVRDAVQERSALYTAENEPVPRDEVEELWNKLSANCWTHLDARFEKGKGFNNLNLLADSRVVNKKVISKKSLLKNCVLEDCFVDLKFNAQGFPTQKSESQEYKSGENLKYWHPRKGAVAGFIANSGGVYLGCNGDPQYSIPTIGVFGCAEGTQK